MWLDRALGSMPLEFESSPEPSPEPSLEPSLEPFFVSELPEGLPELSELPEGLPELFELPDLSEFLSESPPPTPPPGLDGDVETADRPTRKCQCLYIGCGKTFRRHEHLKKHIDAVHRKKKDFHCPECEKTFATECALRVHASHRQGVPRLPR